MKRCLEPILLLIMSWARHFIVNKTRCINIIFSFYCQDTDFSDTVLFVKQWLTRCWSLWEPPGADMAGSFEQMSIDNL